MYHSALGASPKWKAMKAMKVAMKAFRKVMKEAAHATDEDGV